MTYQVTFTESSNPTKPPITVADGTLNNQTGLTFVGQGYTGFAPQFANNFLHLLENFAGSSEPTQPVEGQLWYDTVNRVVAVYDGTTWSPAGALRKSITAPTNSIAGDLWVNTSTSQLYLFSGSNWLLVGPQFSSGTLTGPTVEEIVDITDVVHSVITMYANNNRMAIISKETFIPKSTMVGFATISEGMTLTTVDAANSSAPTRFWGTASSADALLINNTRVASSNFLRSDQSSTTNFPLSVRSDGGISIGSNGGFNIGFTGNSTVLSSNGSGNSIDVKLNDGSGGALTTVIHFSANSRVGIGSNNTSPVSTLDVGGLITSSGGLNVTSAVDSTLVGNGSIRTSGGLSVALRSSFGGSVTTYGQLLVNNLNGLGAPTTAAVISPGSDNADVTYDIGSSSRRFRNIFAQTFVGNFSGNFTGSLTGQVTGKADALSSPTVFRLAGDVSSNDLEFDGQGDNPMTFQTVINQGYITSKVAATDSASTDQFLVYRSSTNTLLKMTKQTFFNHVATIPVGTILPFAGGIIPNGYLLCDGCEVQISRYSLLYATIGHTYKTFALLRGLNTFAIPDLRGRFPLGADNMNNGITVPYKDGSGVFVATNYDKDGTTLSAVANRVTDITADVVGTGSGSQDARISGSGPGGVTAGGTSAGVMNPYATINYIIFTGIIL